MDKITFDRGWFVTYHGSLVQYHGLTFEIVDYDLDTDRFTLRELDVFTPPEALAVLRNTRRGSFTLTPSGEARYDRARGSCRRS